MFPVVSFNKEALYSWELPSERCWSGCFWASKEVTSVPWGHIRDPGLLCLCFLQYSEITGGATLSHNNANGNTLARVGVCHFGRIFLTMIPFLSILLCMNVVIVVSSLHKVRPYSNVCVYRVNLKNGYTFFQHSDSLMFSIKDIRLLQ